MWPPSRKGSVVFVICLWSLGRQPRDQVAEFGAQRPSACLVGAEPVGPGSTAKARAPSSWLRVLSEIKNRGTRDVLMLVCDGLKGLPDPVNSVWEKTIAQTCVVHLLRNSFKYASNGTGPRSPGTSSQFTPRFPRPPRSTRSPISPENGEKRYPAIIRLRENALAEFVPFLQFDNEIRRLSARPTRSSRSTPGCGGR